MSAWILQQFRVICHYILRYTRTTHKSFNALCSCSWHRVHHNMNLGYLWVANPLQDVHVPHTAVRKTVMFQLSKCITRYRQTFWIFIFYFDFRMFFSTKLTTIRVKTAGATNDLKLFWAVYMINPESGMDRMNIIGGDITNLDLST